MNKGINIIELGKKLKLYPRIVVSTKSFDNYNSFYNIYGESEEPCRRVVVLTPYEELEEVNDENPTEEIIGYKIYDNNIWFKTFNLTTNPNKINLEDIIISEDIVNEIVNSKKNTTKNI